MKISICSYSFHRLLEAGKQDIFKYISDCKDFGATHLDPWSGHFQAMEAERGQPPLLNTAAGAEYIEQIKQAAMVAGLPFDCIAVDGAHIYEADSEVRRTNRGRASRWLEVAAKLEVKHLRIDSGYRGENWPTDVFQTIVDGYNDLIAEAHEKGIKIIIENHWGPSKHPENLVKLLEAVAGLGLLFDTGNWAQGKQELGWEMCAKYASACHIKTYSFDEAGNEPSADLAKAINLLRDSGYGGVWGLESETTGGDEYEGVRKTIALIKRVLRA